MKKKMLNMVLLIIVAFIWGSVFWKHFGNKPKSKNQLAMNSPSYDYEYKGAISKDTFQLNITNKNPFAVSKKVKSIRSKKNQQTTNTRSKKQNNQPNKTFTWPKVSYHGYVKSQDKKTRLVILKVNERLYRKREKEKVNELLLVKAYEDSLVISNNKELRTINKIDGKF